MTPISSLPPAAQDKVKMYQDEYPLNDNPNYINSFHWGETEEGLLFWAQVSGSGWQSACEAYPSIAATFEQPTLNMRLVQELREGKVAARNTFRAEDFKLLQSVLKAAFPDDNTEPAGSSDFYYRSEIRGRFWRSNAECPNHMTEIPLADFFRPDEIIVNDNRPNKDAFVNEGNATYQPKRGEMVEATSDPEIGWHVVEFITYEPKSEPGYIALKGTSPKAYHYIRPLSTITLSQIAEKFGIPEDQVRIEGWERTAK